MPTWRAGWPSTVSAKAWSGSTSSAIPSAAWWRWSSPSPTRSARPRWCLSGTTSFFGSADGSFQKAFLKARLGPLDAGQSMAELAKDFASGLLGSEAGPQAAALSRAGLAAVPAGAYRMAITCLVTFNRRNDMGRIATPCLLIAGDEDPNAPLKTMTRMADAIAGARLAVLEHTGHMAPFEKPIQFARLMHEFYEEIAA